MLLFEFFYCSISLPKSMSYYCYSSGKVGGGVDEAFVVRGASTIVGIALVCEIMERIF